MVPHGFHYYCYKPCVCLLAEHVHPTCASFQFSKKMLPLIGQEIAAAEITFCAFSPRNEDWHCLNCLTLVRSPGRLTALIVLVAGVSESPLLTWGEIEGTPFLLDGSDTPLPRNPGGPQFRIPEPRSRERLALSLADGVAKRSAARRTAALDCARSTLLR